MFDSVRVLLFFFAIGATQITTSMSRRNIPDADVIVDVEKGYALERIGKDSSKLSEHLVHSFVPLNDVCVSSPGADVCAYATGSRKTNMLELVSMLAHRSTLTSLETNGESLLTLSDSSNNVGLPPQLQQSPPEQQLSIAQSIFVLRYCSLN